MDPKQKNSFAGKLKSLLDNEDFKNLINAYEEDNEEAYDFKSFKEELFEIRSEKRKKKLQKDINKKRGIENKKKTTKINKKKENLDNRFEINEDTISEDNNKINNLDNSHPYIFFIKDEEENEKSYTYHRTYKEYYHLRCTDRKCLGTAKYNIANGKIEINTKCSIKYDEHSYIKEKLIQKKIIEDKLENKDIEGDMHIQEIFFKYMNSIQPNLNYYDIALYMHEKYEVKIIIYSKTQFINYKNRNKKDIKYHEAREHMLDNIEFN